MTWIILEYLISIHHPELDVVKGLSASLFGRHGRCLYSSAISSRLPSGAAVSIAWAHSNGLRRLVMAAACRIHARKEGGVILPFSSSFISMRHEPKLHVQEAAVRIILAQCSLHSVPSNESQGNPNARPGPALPKHVIHGFQTSHVAAG